MGKEQAMRRVALVVVLPLVIGGCAGSKTTEAESAGGTADTLVKTCAAGRARESLEVLSPPAKDFFTSAPSALRACLDILGLRSRAALRDTRVVSVRANDLSATAELTTADGSRSRLELEKSRGVWSVTYPR